MEFQDRQFLGLGRRHIAFVVVALASLMLASAGAAQAKRMSGTAGADRIVGTAKADVIKSGAGNDRIKGRGGRDRLSGGRGSDRLAGGSGRDRLSGGRGSDRLAGGSGRDRLSGGRGADRLNTVDGRADRVVMGGPGRDICRLDPADEAKGCEIVKIIKPGAPGAPGAPGVPGAPVVPGGPTVCATPPEDAALARVAGGDPPPVFSDAFYAITTTITASADGLTGTDLPISIEDVCDVPQSLATEAAQLVGGDGVALITPATQVFDATGVLLLTGAAATTALGGRHRRDQGSAPAPRRVATGRGR